MRYTLLLLVFLCFSSIHAPAALAEEPSGAACAAEKKELKKLIRQHKAEADRHSTDRGREEINRAVIALKKCRAEAQSSTDQASSGAGASSTTAPATGSGSTAANNNSTGSASNSATSGAGGTNSSNAASGSGTASPVSGSNGGGTSATTQGSGGDPDRCGPRKFSFSTDPEIIKLAGKKFVDTKLETDNFNAIMALPEEKHYIVKSDESVYFKGPYNWLAVLFLPGSPYDALAVVALGPQGILISYPSPSGATKPGFSIKPDYVTLPVHFCDQTASTGGFYDNLAQKGKVTLSSGSWVLSGDRWVLWGYKFPNYWNVDKYFTVR